MHSPDISTLFRGKAERKHHQSSASGSMYGSTVPSSTHSHSERSSSPYFSRIRFSRSTTVSPSIARHLTAKSQKIVTSTCNSSRFFSYACAVLAVALLIEILLRGCYPEFRLTEKFLLGMQSRFVMFLKGPIDDHRNSFIVLLLKLSVKLTVGFFVYNLINSKRYR